MRKVKGRSKAERIILSRKHKLDRILAQKMNEGYENGLQPILLSEN